MEVGIRNDAEQRGQRMEETVGSAREGDEAQTAIRWVQGCLSEQRGGGKS